jgi:hypothetical protein
MLKTDLRTPLDQSIENFRYITMMLLLEINWYDGVRIRSSSAQEVSTMTKPITLSKRTNKKKQKQNLSFTSMRSGKG